MSPAKTDEQIEMLFGLCTRVGPRNHALGGGPDPPPPGGRGSCGGCSAPSKMHCNENAENSNIHYNMQYTYVHTAFGLSSIWM